MDSAALSLYRVLQGVYYRVVYQLYKHTERQANEKPVKDRSIINNALTWSYHRMK